MAQVDNKYATSNDVPYTSGSGIESGEDAERDWTPEEEKKAKAK